MFDISLFSEYVRISLNWFAGITVGSIFLLWITGSTKSIFTRFFGEMEEGEVEKYSILSLCFGLIVGAYWMMRTLKDPIFFELVGKGYQPYAKMIAPIVLGFVLFAYSKVVDRFKKHQLFWIVCGVYGLIFTGVGLLWVMDLPQLHHPLVDWIPGRFIGWLYFTAVESFGGIIVGAVFWAFVASTTKTVSAKKGYPIIIIGAQVGNFFGPAINAGYAPLLGNKILIFISAGMVFIIPLIMSFYMHVIPAHLHESDDGGHKKKAKTGALEGIRLIVTQPFLLGVLVVSTVYEVVGTIIDYQFKVLASEHFADSAFTVFNSLFAMSSALVGMAIAMFGIGVMIRRLGVSRCLLAYPTLIGITVVCLWIYPAIGMFFAAMIAVKAFSYSINTPIKELLYLPTSKDVKYKAKGFIDGFGGKSAKSAGSMVTSALAGDLQNLLAYGSIISLGVVGFWVIVAIALGKK